MTMFLRRVAFLAVLTACTSFAGAVAQAQSGRIQFNVVKAGFIVGISGGSGTLHLKGNSYPLSIGGVSLGLTIGASKAELIGTVHNISKPSDISGTYTALKAGVAVAGGAKIAELKNSKGVVLKVKGKQIGLEFALDLSGLNISLK
jgi:hypothetical protein